MNAEKPLRPLVWFVNRRGIVGCRHAAQQAHAPDRQQPASPPVAGR